MVEFKKAVVPDEIEALSDFDRRAFHLHPQDVFTPELWKRYESYWMVAEGRTVGCAAFLPDADYDERRRPRCLYIASTGILPEFQNQSFGKQLKQWEIEFAKERGFERLVTLMRRGNDRIIRLNTSLGFVVRQDARFVYSNGEPGVVMELELSAPVCPECGKPLRTRRAKQCRFCHADWH
jgi:GNAT superfamily N-acetyltransferase